MEQGIDEWRPYFHVFSDSILASESVFGIEKGNKVFAFVDFTSQKRIFMK